MRLASEDTVITIAGQPVTLRPSLRAAMRLVHRHDTFAALALGVMHGRATLMADLITEGSGSAQAASDFLCDIAYGGAGKALASAQVPLLEFVTALAGYDPDRSATPTTGKPIPILEYYEQLFGIATGWLGWTPEQAWHATPAEIIAAKSGRVGMITELLAAVFGTAEETTDLSYSRERLQEIDELGHDPAFDRNALQAFKSKVGA